MITLRRLKEEIQNDPENGIVHLMDFVDDFRHYKDLSALEGPLGAPGAGDRWDALLASTAEYLCRELDIQAPEWLEKVPACKDPWFLSGMENLKAIALVESPLPFRLRKIFVLENFLSRV